MIIDLDAWDALPAQAEIYDDTTTKILTLSGGLGSGKSYVGVRKALQLSALNQGFAGGFLCPAYSDFRKDIKPLFEEILEEQLGLVKNKHWFFHNTHKEYTFIWNKKPLYIFTAENPIAGPNLAYCVINEFSLMKWERVNEMMRRVRVKDAQYKQRVLVGTPEDTYAWLEEFVDNQESINKDVPENFKIVYSDTRDNTHIDPDYRRQLESMLDEQQLKVFASGQIVKLGSDYFYYAYDDSKNVSEKAVYNKDAIVHVGLDFNVGRMCASLSHVYGNDEDKELHVFDEIELLGNSDTRDMKKALLARYSADQMVITCDAAGNNRGTIGLKNMKSDVSILRAAAEGLEGLKVRFKSHNQGMRKRQLLMNGLISHQKILIHPKCKKVRRDFKKVRQDQTDFTKSKKIPELTHFSDGIDYICDFEFKLPERKLISPSSVSRPM
jgi:hypothetical protein